MIAGVLFIVNPVGYNRDQRDPLQRCSQRCSIEGRMDTTMCGALSSNCNVVITILSILFCK